MSKEEESTLHVPRVSGSGCQLTGGTAVVLPKIVKPPICTSILTVKVSGVSSQSSERYFSTCSEEKVIKVLTPGVTVPERGWEPLRMKL